MILLYARVQGTDERLPVLVDTVDLDVLRRTRLLVRDHHGYRSVYVRTSYAEHRELGFGEQTPMVLARFLLRAPKGDPRIVDHINRDTLDNRRENLRFVTVRTNVVNSARRRTNKSGYKGVILDHGRWRATVNAGGDKRQSWHADPVSAALWYDEQVQDVYGPEAATNASLGLL